MKGDTLEAVREALINATDIAITAHQNPDGDAIGACLALALSLQIMGKRPLVLLEPYGGKYDVISGKEFVVPLEDYAALEPELCIALDCGSLERLGKAVEVFALATKSMVIDHHKNNEYFGTINLVEEKKSSASELVFDIINGFMPMNHDIASALYVGIIYDTGAFRHSSTSPATMAAAAALMEYGIPYTKLYHLFFDSRSFTEMKLMGQAFANAKQLFSGKFIYTTITNQEIANCNGSSKELDAIVNYIKGVRGTSIACFLYEKEAGNVKASFRCEDGFDVCALAIHFGGGGHVKAAGCIIEAPIEEAVEMLAKEVEKLF